MTVFSLQLFQSVGSERIDNLVLLSGEDASGRFGIQARHTRFTTVLSSGLVKLVFADRHSQFLALPGGLLDVRGDTVTVHTRRYWRSADAVKMLAVLRQDEDASSRSLRNIKTNLAKIENTMMQRLIELERQP